MVASGEQIHLETFEICKGVLINGIHSADSGWLATPIPYSSVCYDYQLKQN